MRYILNDMEPDSSDYILAARAAHSVAKDLDEPVVKEHKGGGGFVLIEFEDGSMFAVKVNKASLSVWKQ